MASSSDPLADFEGGDDMDSFPPPGDEGKNLFQLRLLIPAITVVIYNNKYNQKLGLCKTPPTRGDAIIKVFGFVASRIISVSFYV